MLKMCFNKLWWLLINCLLCVYEILESNYVSYMCVCVCVCVCVSLCEVVGQATLKVDFRYLSNLIEKMKFHIIRNYDVVKANVLSNLIERDSLNSMLCDWTLDTLSWKIWKYYTLNLCLIVQLIRTWFDIKKNLNDKDLERSKVFLKVGDCNRTVC